MGQELIRLTKWRKKADNWLQWEEGRPCEANGCSTGYRTEREALKRQCANLNGEHGDSLWHVYVVPHTEVVCVLSHHHITEGHPLLGGVQHVGGVMLLIKLITRILLRQTCTYEQ